MALPTAREFSRIKEAVASWSSVRQFIRSGDDGALVPVVIPKDRRRIGWIVMTMVALYLVGVAVFGAGATLQAAAGAAAAVAVVIAGLMLWRGSIVEIEQGTTGIRSRYGAFVSELPPGRHYLWSPWDKVEFVVDTSTEIPYNAPVVACPTRENVPLKSIEFFLKFRIEKPVAFVRTIGAGNFDMVLSSAVQDAIRRRGRSVQTERAYDLRGSDVGDMQQVLNRQLEAYGVQIIGANIPDVQLPDSYHQHLSTQERVAKERVAYEREWELTRKRRIDGLLMEIERAKKTRDAKLVEVKAALNRARQDVAQMLQERETEAQRVRWEIETRGRTELVAAENEATARRRLSQAYRDNRAVLAYQLARRQLDVGRKLVERAPQPVIIRGTGGESSALSTLLLAQLLPRLGAGAPAPNDAGTRGSVSAESIAATAEQARQTLKGLAEDARSWPG